jgi:hypothetical protein
VALARESGAERRAAVLARVGAVGALAFSEPELSRALVRGFGAPNGGLVTPADFARPEGLDVPAARSGQAAVPLLAAPWAAQALTAFVRGVTVSAIDVNGLFMAAAFDCQPEGLYVEELELSAPLLAVPTLRGVPRVTPGSAIAAAAPIWISYDTAGSPHELWAAPTAKSVAESGVRRIGIRRHSATRTVEALEE